MNKTILSILMIVIGLILGITLAFIIKTLKEKSTENKVKKMLDLAKKDADKIKRDILLEAKEESHKIKLDTEREVKEKKQELKETENRIMQRENSMDKRDELFQKREQLLDEKEQKLEDRQRQIQLDQEEMEKLKKEQIELLSKISALDKEKARELLMQKIEEDMQQEINSYIKECDDKARLEADRNAKDLIVGAMQKYASDIANEQTVSTITLPSDEMKGRIIGREGRNIRTIEAITGVDLIIDDTPEAIVISSFDPLRREIAKITIETLIKDGRIHPTRIEELYDKTCKDMKSKIMEYGNNALFELGLTKMDNALVELVGKLHFRTSYGQNALTHSIEVAHLAGIMAGELGENINLAKRAGLLHDIGKAIDHEVEGSHVELGKNLAKKYHEHPVVINAISSHHGDCDPTSVISVLVQIADALSASRPGARNDSLENYIQRLQQLEAVANDIKGVDKTFAVQAGRELRVVVKPEEIDDLKIHKVAREIKDKIEREMQYPGTIKVTVIRETRVQEEAK